MYYLVVLCGRRPYCDVADLPLVCVPRRNAVYKDGKVCISILHAPGSDPNEYENASERWLPVHTVESILVSVISMLASPNDESAANLDAAKEWRDENILFKKKVRETVRRAQEDI
jgi:ubiquitin-conjugating enzyme E2 G1